MLVCAKLLVFGGGLGRSDERGKEASVTSLQGSSFLVNPSPYSPVFFSRARSRTKTSTGVNNLKNVSISKVDSCWTYDTVWNKGSFGNSDGSKGKFFAVIQPDLSKLKSKKHSCTEENATLYVVFNTLTLH